MTVATSGLRVVPLRKPGIPWPDVGTVAACALFCGVGAFRRGIWEQVEIADVTSRARMAVLAFASVLFFGFAIARVHGKHAGRIAAIVLASTPLVYAHALLATGQMIGIASSTILLSSLLLATRSSLLATPSPAVTSSWWILAAVPSAFFAWRALGPVQGVLPALVGVGLTLERKKIWIVSSVVVLALAFVPAHASLSFDAVLAKLAHGAFPYSALAPLALAQERSKTRDALIGATAVAYFACAISPSTSVFVSCAAPIGLVALAIAEPSYSRVARFASAAMCVLLVLDVVRIDDEIASAVSAKVPASVVPVAVRFGIAAGVFLGVGLLVPRVLAWCAIASAATIRFGVWPTLLAHASPQGAFDTYLELRRPNDSLAVLGVSERSAFHAGATTVVVTDPSHADEWIRNGEGRYLAFRGDFLPSLNAEHRAHTGKNLAVPFARSSAVMLASNDDAHDESPLRRVVLDRAPEGIHVVGANLSSTLVLEGWDLGDDDGKRVSALSGSTHLRVYWRVLQPPGGGWCTFFHLDRSPTRTSMEDREHATYPMPLWRAGDVIVDDFEVRLPPHVTAARHPLYLGAGALPCNDDRRMHVTSGPNDGNDRVVAGMVDVR